MAQEIPSGRKIAIAAATALAIAIVILVTTVLPAEYGIDPLGVGRALGLSALAEERPAVMADQAAPYKMDSVEFILAPFESIEYKYRLEKGASMVYSWEATGVVLYDFHSEPDGGPAGYAESFDKQERNQGHGTYTAPFSGIHGWFWQNRGLQDVTIKLTTAGFYRTAQEMSSSGTVFHRLRDAHTGTSDDSRVDEP